MSKREVLVTEGSFSKLTITLNDDITNKLALIEKENNPLAKVEEDLKRALRKFEKEYFNATKA